LFSQPQVTLLNNFLKNKINRLAEKNSLGMVDQEPSDSLMAVVRDLKSFDLKEHEIRELSEGRRKDVLRHPISVEEAQVLQGMSPAETQKVFDGQ
jgi:hypothetical protein